MFYHILSRDTRYSFLQHTTPFAPVADEPCLSFWSLWMTHHVLHSDPESQGLKYFDYIDEKKGKTLRNDVSNGTQTIQKYNTHIIWNRIGLLWKLHAQSNLVCSCLILNHMPCESKWDMKKPTIKRHYLNATDDKWLYSQQENRNNNGWRVGHYLRSPAQQTTLLNEKHPPKLEYFV